MTLRQWKTVDVLKDNDNYNVVEADTNLGGDALNRAVYNTKGIPTHLGNTTVYKRVINKEATERNSILR